MTSLIALSGCAAMTPTPTNWNASTGDVSCGQPPIGATTGVLGFAAVGALAFYSAAQPDPPPPADGSQIHIPDPSFDSGTDRAIGYALLGGALLTAVIGTIEWGSYHQCHALEPPLRALMASHDCASIVQSVDEIGSISPEFRHRVIASDPRIEVCLNDVAPPVTEPPPVLTPCQQARRTALERAQTFGVAERTRLLTQLPHCE